MRRQYLPQYARVYASCGLTYARGCDAFGGDPLDPDVLLPDDALSGHTLAYATHAGGTLDPDVLLPDDALGAPPQAVSSEKHHVGAVH